MSTYTKYEPKEGLSVLLIEQDRSREVVASLRELSKTDVLSDKASSLLEEASSLLHYYHEMYGVVDSPFVMSLSDEEMECAHCGQDWRLPPNAYKFFKGLAKDA